MSNISLQHIYKKYDNGYEAVKDFNLEIKDQEFIIFVGPSGCGKSTTLRMIAGLEEISDGELFIDGQLMNDVEPKDRDIAMVFQSYALYPHMTVYENIAFGMRFRKEPKDEIDRKVKEAARILDLEPYLDVKPRNLSGGQRQRVAMGRAIVRNPKVFLMDEPLSNLDAKLRVQMRVELTNLHKRLGATIIYVTHDQVEAMTLGSRIVVMKDGVVQQIDSPDNLYNKPCNKFVAGFIGSPQMNFMDADIAEEGDKLYAVVDGAKLLIPDDKAKNLKDAGYIGKTVTLGVRPEHIHNDPDVLAALKDSQITVNIEVFEMLGDDALLYFDYAGERLTAKTNIKYKAVEGDTVTFTFDMEESHFFDKESELTITN